MSAIRVNGQWKTPSIVYAKVEGQWKIVGQSYSKVDGLWRQTTFAGPPTKPTMSYVSAGVFQISNYNSTLIYEAIFKVGSGSASFNSSNGRYTLNGVNSGFDVVARYATGAPPSAAGYMERKAYVYDCRQVSYTESFSCNCSLDAGCGQPFQPCPPGQLPSFGQCGIDGPMCWAYYNGVVCQTCTRTACCQTICDVLRNESGYTNSGSEWYKVL
jgi:hypothetical protein